MENDGHHRHKSSLSSMSSESLSTCTEGLGFESFDVMEDMQEEGCVSEEWQPWQGFEMKTVVSGGRRRSRITGAVLPPPISSIGRSGKPWVSLEAFREDGRFILKEVIIPAQEVLYACREDGRLKLKFIQSHDDPTIDEQ